MFLFYFPAGDGEGDWGGPSCLHALAFSRPSSFSFWACFADSGLKIEKIVSVAVGRSYKKRNRQVFLYLESTINVPLKV